MGHRFNLTFILPGDDQDSSLVHALVNDRLLVLFQLVVLADGERVVLRLGRQGPVERPFIKGHGWKPWGIPDGPGQAGKGTGQGFPDGQGLVESSNVEGKG